MATLKIHDGTKTDPGEENLEITTHLSAIYHLLLSF